MQLTVIRLLLFIGAIAAQTCIDNTWHLVGSDFCYMAYEAPQKSWRGARGYCRRQVSGLGIVASGGALLSFANTRKVLKDMEKRADQPDGVFRLDGYQGKYAESGGRRQRWLENSGTLINRDMSMVKRKRKKKGSLIVKPTTGEWFGHLGKYNKAKFICQHDPITSPSR